MIQEETRLRIAKMIADAYTTGDFEPLFPLMTEDYEHHSFWVFEPMRGKATVLPYYRGKGNALKRSRRKIKARLVRTVDPAMKQIPGAVHINGEEPKPHTRTFLWTPAGQILVLMEQETDDGDVNTCVAVPTLNDDGMLTRLTITVPELYNFEPIE